MSGHVPRRASVSGRVALLSVSVSVLLSVPVSDARVRARILSVSFSCPFLTCVRALCPLSYSRLARLYPFM